MYKLMTAILGALNAGISIYMALNGKAGAAAFSGAVTVFVFYLGKDYTDD
jgi:hypothetical protein